MRGTHNLSEAERGRRWDGKIKPAREGIHLVVCPLRCLFKDMSGWWREAKGGEERRYEGGEREREHCS